MNEIVTGEVKSKDIKWHESLLRKDHREKLLQQSGCVIWMTGLSGSGKSTISRAVEEFLVEDGRFAYVLDGDNVRHRLNEDLGFSPDDRRENIRRCSELAHLFADAGAIAIAAFISPYRADRERARAIVGEHAFIEVHVATPIEICEQRDPKGLYKRARAGEIGGFTGISAPYEEPLGPDICLRPDQKSVAQCVEEIIAYIYRTGILTKRTDA